MPQLQAGELVQDLSIYPRSAVSQVHIGTLVDALRSGAVFPPVVVERDTRRIVDGFHRTGAVIRLNGPEAPIEVEERAYDSEAELFLECVRLNAAHGLGLTTFDKAKVSVKAQELGIAEADLSASLFMPVDRLAQLTARRIARDDGHLVPIKPVAEHLAGQQLSDKQISGMRRAGGMKVTGYCSQILNALRSDLIDTTDRPTMERLAELRRALDEFLKG